MELRLSQEWQTTTWLNVPDPLILAGLQDRLCCNMPFPMICPTLCRVHGNPSGSIEARV